MLFRNVNKDVQDLINQLFISIKKMTEIKRIKPTHSGVYDQVDACHRLFLNGSRNFIFEFYNNTEQMQKEMALPNKLQLLQQLQNPQFEHLVSVSKRSHFNCFNYLDNIAVKAMTDFNEKSYLYIPLDRFSDHIINYHSTLGICHFELMQYFNFLDLYYQNSNYDHCFIINLYKNSRFSVFTLAEVQSALNEFLTTQNQPMDLSITGRYL